ncbi:LacI family DNA-binding transcriptional regulator [Pedobacter psychrodurus]|uniref:LacI family DNA-binding transcriptional regulator n=1 Tax=Pedobacter psychrodurus TaxID=2530456 RepID=UPI0029310FC3|nr:substrate-binding domain-containing protein [Pedobacter psychrodurus]
MEKKISIIEVAKRLDVSPTTVSFILNGRSKEKRISDEIRDKVLKFVEEIGYKPNSLARSLRTGKTNTIALMVESISDPFFGHIARNIEEKAYKSGYKILYSSTGNNTEKTKEFLKMYEERHVDAYIIAAPEGIEGELQAIIDSGKPVLLFDRYLKDLKTDTILVDNYQSTAKAVEELIQSGFKNIAFITLDSLQSQMNDRLLGYEETLKKHKLPQYLKEISYDFPPEKVTAHIEAFLQRRGEIDAVVFATNYLCVYGLKAIEKLGLIIPKDLGIVVFDDQDLFELYKPQITAIAQPIEEIANQIISLLLNKLNNPVKTKKIQTIILNAEMIIRGSSSRA